MFKRLIPWLGAGVLSATLVLPAASARAVSYGDPDGGAHPNVGVLVGTFDVGGTSESFAVCSGALLAPRYFLTAGHCFTAIEAAFPDVTWQVSFASQVPPYSPSDPQFPPVQVDPTSIEADLIPVSDRVVDPDARLAGNPGFDDVAVAQLASAPPGISPISLPPVGFLDAQKARGELTGHELTLVGYGTDAQWNVGPASGTGPPLTETFDGRRGSSTVPVHSLTKTFVMSSANHTVTGSGGGCNSDSGAPLFWEAAGSDAANLAVSIDIWGDARCRSLDSSQRLDTPGVHAFLQPFVDAVSGR